jgi:hypothetical protein
MSSEEAADETAQGNETTPDESAEKKKGRRRPVWVCVPVDFDETSETNDDGDVVSIDRVPTKYTRTECNTKAEVLTALAAHEIDVTNIGDVIMFRADRLDFAVTNQLNIRY